MVAGLKHGLWARVMSPRMRSNLGEQGSSIGAGGVCGRAGRANALVLLDELLDLGAEKEQLGIIYYFSITTQHWDRKAACTTCTSRITRSQTLTILYNPHLGSGYGYLVL